VEREVIQKGESQRGKTTIPLDKNDMPTGILNRILKGFDLNMNVDEFLRL
jgi:predicted RNA binding protein YcfA (HicA-like mRNA interferase family)